MSSNRRVGVTAAVLTLMVHLAANPHYGFFRDELYFIMCGRHPAWGYVDQPPVVPLIAAATQLFGHSLLALRAAAALFAAASVYVTCVIAVELGGGTVAQVLAALGAAMCPVLVNFGMKVGTDMVGLWLWPLAVLYVLRIARGADPRLWIVVGAAIGISAEAKYSVLYLAFALVAGLLCTPELRILRSRWFAAGVAVAAIIALPNFLWQAAHGFPMLELLRNGQRGKNIILSPLAYLFAEVLITNPALALLWIAGLVWLLARPASRFLGCGFLFLIGAMVASHAKHYYPADVYPCLFAAGGVAIEQLTRRRAWLRPVIVGAAASCGLVLLPYVLPILPVGQFIGYHKIVAPLLHLEAARTEHQRMGALPQDWADMHGWPELADTVARVANALPPGDRARAVIAAQNYGEAAALEFFGAQYNLPPVISGHNQYFLWGPPGHDGDVLIDVGGDCGARDHLFRQSERAATFSAPYVMPYESDLPIMVCRGIGRPLERIWPTLKSYN